MRTEEELRERRDITARSVYQDALRLWQRSWVMMLEDGKLARRCAEAVLSMGMFEGLYGSSREGQRFLTHVICQLRRAARRRERCCE